jgi:hypothetical protein
MPNEIVGFGDLIFFFGIILSEVITKCVKGFGEFVRILED